MLDTVMVIIHHPNLYVIRFNSKALSEEEEEK